MRVPAIEAVQAVLVQEKPITEILMFFG